MDKMITLLIGHRGTGKTQYLRLLSHQRCFDLDAEMERRQEKTIAELFAQGEEHFRRMERQTLDTLIAENKGNLIVALGAGFEGPLPAQAKVIWIRRESDAAGRIFLNRPRLNPEMSAFAEYMARYDVRQKRFREWAHEQLTLPEGYLSGLEDFVNIDATFEMPFDLTLRPEDFHDWPVFWAKRRQWNIRRFELRDDLLSSDQMRVALDTIPHEKIIYAHRESSAPLGFSLNIDWPLELGRPAKRAYILSLHHREADLHLSLKKFEECAQDGEILKLAAEIHSFAELKAGHDWWLKDPQRRAFLPRSKNGKWRWYRSLFGARMPVHFFREGEGSSLDQPLLWQLRLQPPLIKNFAAVLGSPVEHSLSPLEQRDFFAKREMPFVAIPIVEHEFAQAWPVLKQLGLTHAAVTAPLKNAAFDICSSFTPEAQQLKSANTLWISGDSVLGHNTDVLALEKIKLEQPPFANIWLWGGGGTVSSVKSVWPNAIHIKAREGSSRVDSPDLLIWAVGRFREFKMPHKEIRPRLVLDLNYSDDSPGLEYAASQNLPYQSGLRMFKLQAEFQRGFWKGKE